MSYLQLGHTTWPFAAVEKMDDLTLSAVPAFGQPVLKKARDWLNGVQAFTLYTSGSTGSPQPYTFSREQVIASAKQTIEYFSLSEKAVLLNPLSVTYVAGFMMLMRSMVLQAPLVQLPPARQPIPDHLLDTEHQLTALVPFQFKAIANASEKHRQFLSKIQTILLGGGPLPSGVETTAKEIGTAVYHTYGMTETLTHVAVRKLSPETQPHFEALPGNQFSQDEAGRVVIQTPIREGPVATNDRVDLIDSTHFRWLGRADRIINSGGYKVQTEWVEQVIGDLLVKHQKGDVGFFLSSLPDDQLGERVIMVIEMPEEGAISNEDLYEGLYQNLPRYAVPKAIYHLPGFTLTHTGKVDKKACLDRLNLRQA